MMDSGWLMQIELKQVKMYLFDRLIQTMTLTLSLSLMQTVNMKEKPYMSLYYSQF